MSSKPHALFHDDDDEDKPKMRLPSSALANKPVVTAPTPSTSSTTTTSAPSSLGVAKAPGASKSTVDYSHYVDEVPAAFDPSRHKPTLRAAGLKFRPNDEDAPLVMEGLVVDYIQPENENEGDEDAKGIASLMGFNAFGDKKHLFRQMKKDLFMKESLESTKREKTFRTPGTAADSEEPEESSIDVRSAMKASEATDDADGEAKTKGDDNETGDGQLDDDEEDEEDDDAEGGATDSIGIPISNEAKLDHGVKPITALAVDPAGARVVTGGYDSIVKFWDFAAMNKTLRSFREIEPFEKHNVRSLQFSRSGDCILIATGCAQAKIVDRDGIDILTFLKGDQYLLDLAKTHGHVATINSAVWHPSNRDKFITCSDDSTIRLWDVNNHRCSASVVKARTVKGQRAPVTTCTWNKDATLVAGGCTDGSIRLWNLASHGFRASLQNDAAHQPQTEVSSLVFSRDNHTLLSRSTDGTLKIWDIRSFKKNVHAFDNLPCFYGMTDCSFSPDEKYILTGTSSKQENEAGLLCLFNTQTYAKEMHLAFPQNGVIRSHWNPRLNQIFATTITGKISIFFDVVKSFRGAILSVGKAERKRDPHDLLFDQTGHIYTPEFENLRKVIFKAGQTSAKRKRERARSNPVTSAKPETPVQNEKGGMQGRLLGFSSTISQFAAKQIAYDDRRDEDPREALLKYAEVTEKDPYWTGAAYQKTQPTPIFDTTPMPEDDDDGKIKKRKFDPNLKPRYG